MTNSILFTTLPDTDGSRCTITFEEPEQWLRATWRGFVDMDEARRGAAKYLEALASLQCPYLLNDNVALRGPWFDSLEWLEQVWLPRALGLGLRYVAHVVQADSLTDIVTVSFPVANALGLELQIFQHVPDAEAWLRQCQQQEEAGEEHRRASIRAAK